MGGGMAVPPDALGALTAFVMFVLLGAGLIAVAYFW